MRMDIVFLLPLMGTLLGVAGFFFSPWLFWIGVAACSLSLFLDLASGVLKLPILPATAIGAGALVIGPWYIGAGAGLVFYASLEVAAMLLAGRRHRP